MDKENNEDSVTQEEAALVAATSSAEAPKLEVRPTPDVIKFDIGQFVYHRLDPHGEPGLIMGLLSQPGHYKYLVRWERAKDNTHFDFELSSKPCLRDVPRIMFDDDDDDDD